MLKPIFFGLCLLLGAATAEAAAPVAKIQAMLAKQTLLCGRFDQSKQLNGMKKPLASHGRFCVDSAKGVLWRTLQPFPSTLRLTRDEIVQFQGERVAMRLEAKQEPSVRMINNVLFALLAGDLARLETLFEVEGGIDAATWHVTLKARDPALARAIGGITLDGGAHVKNITMLDAGGDRTSIVFSQIQSGDAAILPEEAALF